MKLSQAIYRLSKMARVLDIDGCEDDVIALNVAVDVMSAALMQEQVNASTKHVTRPDDFRRGHIGGGIYAKIKEKV